MKATALALLLGTALLSACTPASTARPAAAPTAQTTTARASTQDRLLVRQASMELEASRPVDAAREVEQITRGVGGHVEEATDREAKRVRMVLRVPAPALDSVLGAVGRLGKVKDRQISAVDVTEQTTDLEARLQNLIAVRDRLRQHLQRADAVADVIAVERELARVQTEIDILERRLRELRSSVALSRVALDIHRPRVLGPLGVVVSGVANLIGKLFVIQ
ncbi:MAG TPA: DUF4349 domain-containing protein [Longimicrobium sp.]|nr:DUF4349 domain-containing protein [Longimicrobium sp.]